MTLLPRGTPVKENINPGSVDLPVAFDRLRQGHFTGYLRFSFADSEALLLFQAGRLISAFYESSGEKLHGAEAIARIFASSRTGNGTLHIYRLGPELALQLHHMLHGEPVLRDSDVRQVNIPALLARMRNERHSGSLHVYTPRTAVLIFYRDGHPLGFFHDGTAEIATTADLARSVAREPGARINVLLQRGESDQSPADLLATVPIPALWQAALAGRSLQGAAATVAGRPATVA